MPSFHLVCVFGLVRFADTTALVRHVGKRNSGGATEFDRALALADGALVRHVGYRRALLDSSKAAPPNGWPHVENTTSVSVWSLYQPTWSCPTLSRLGEWEAANELARTHMLPQTGTNTSLHITFFRGAIGRREMVVWCAIVGI